MTQEVKLERGRYVVRDKVVDTSRKSNFHWMAVSLLFLLIIVCLVGYISFNQMESNAVKEKEHQALIIQNATLQGATTVLNNIILQLINCPPQGLELPVGNRTIHLILAECYQEVKK